MDYREEGTYWVEFWLDEEGTTYKAIFPNLTISKFPLTIEKTCLKTFLPK